MAIRLVTTTCADSTSAGSCKKVEAANFALGTEVSGSPFDDVNTARTSSAHNATVGVSVQGVYLFLRRNGTTGTFTIQLQEGNAASGSTIWTDVTIANGFAVNANTTLNVNATNIPSNSSYKYFTLGSAYTATANQLRWKLTASNSGQVQWWRDTTAGNYSYATVGNGDDATGISANDTVLIDANVALTLDQTRTLAATNGFTIMVGDGASLLVPKPASTIAIDTGSGVVQHCSLGFTKIGTSGTPVTAANRVVLNTSVGNFGTIFVFTHQSYDTLKGAYIEMYGETSNLLAFSCNAANSGQAVVTTPSAHGLTNGDTVTFAGKDTSTADNTTYTVTVDSTTQFTLNTNLNIALAQGARCINLSEADRNLGIKINSTNQTLIVTGGVNVYLDHQIMQGVYMVNCGLYGNYNYGSTANSFTSILSYLNGTQSGFVHVGANTATLVFSNVHLINQQANPGNIISGITGPANITNMTVRNMGSTLFGNTVFRGNSITASDLVMANGTSGSSAFSTFSIGGNNHSFSNVYAIGTFFGIACNSSSFTNVVQRTCIGYGTQFGNSISNTFTDCTFGVGTTNTTYDIAMAFSYSGNTSSLIQNFFNNCLVGGRGVSPALTAIAGSYFRFQKYGQTANDHRIWEVYGLMVSTGYSLTDTTVWNGTAFATAASGQFGFKITPLSGSSVFRFQDNNPNTTLIGNCQNLPVLISCRVKINNAAFYSGTHTKPTLKVTYDGSTVASSVASGSTADQQLVVNFTPTTTNADITITLEMATDATGTNRDVYVGELMVLKPGGVSVDTTKFSQGWAKGLPLGTSRTFPSPESIWDVPRTAHAVSGSFGEAQPTKEEIRAEIDSNSEQLANIVGVTSSID